MSMPPQLSTVPAQRRPEQSEADLVRAAQAGDREAFGQLYRTYYDMVLRFVRFRVNDVQVAQDITQTVFARALRSVARYEDQGRSFGAWLVTIAKNLILDRYKSGLFRLEISTGDLFDLDETRIAIVEDAAAAHVIRSVLERALDRLTPEQRLCLKLRFTYGCSVDETAQAMETTVGATKALQYRALRALARDPEVRALAVETTP